MFSPKRPFGSIVANSWHNAGRRNGLSQICWVNLCERSPTMAEPVRKFETERTRRFRAEALTESEERAIGNIEAFGCTVLQIKSNGAGPAFSYTMGNYDIAGKPEVIT